MINRIWHGRTKAEDADKYLPYIQNTGLIDYTSTPGNISARILRRIENNFCHFITVSEWQNMESIIQFAGNDYEKAKYYEEDQKYLLEFEENVMHYETYYPI